MDEVWALGLDIGRRRIGLAGCDRLGLTAIELPTLTRTTMAEDIDAIGAVVRDRQIKQLVIGVPYAHDGTLGKQAQRTKKQGRKFANALEIPVAWMDERCTSVTAESMLRDRGVDPAFHRDRIDGLAAVLILQAWLDEQRAAKSECS
ncbi:MAG: Holliday junction resolvase RuvX [Cyanobacteria bacterium P01_C01_bin.89]